MKLIYLAPLTLMFGCSEPEVEIITEIIYKTDTIYVEVEKPMDVFPWELGCTDSAETQAEMNICAGKCFVVSDSLTNQVYELIKSDQHYINSTYERDEKIISEQRERLKVIHESFSKIKTLSTEYQNVAFGEGTIMPLVRLTTKTWINEFEYQLLWCLGPNILEG